jgi:hypothetical protein
MMKGISLNLKFLKSGKEWIRIRFSGGWLNLAVKDVGYNLIFCSEAETF